MASLSAESYPSWAQIFPHRSVHLASQGEAASGDGSQAGMRSLGPLDLLRQFDCAVQPFARDILHPSDGAHTLADQAAAIDPLTAATALHYVARSGAAGVGDDEAAAQLASELVAAGASLAVPDLRGCLPLHTAAFYGATAVARVLLQHASQFDIDARTEILDGATALHLAVMGGHLEILEELLQAGVDPEARDDLERRPIDVARSILAAPNEYDDAPTIEKMIELLERASRNFSGPPSASRMPRHSRGSIFDTSLPPAQSYAQTEDGFSDASSMISGNFIDDDEINVGDRVMVRDKGEAIVRFKGFTKFKPGLWYGVQLEEPTGKNNGTVGLITYFRSKPNHGAFVRRHHLEKIDSRSGTPNADRRRSAPAVRRRSAAAPFTAPTFRTAKSVRPDNGHAGEQSNYTFIHQLAAESPRTPSSNGSTPSLARRASAAATPSANLSPSTARERVGSKRTSPLGGGAGAVRTPARGSVKALSTDKFDLSARVLCRGQMGSVVFIGETKLGSGPYIGIETLTDGAGEHDGEVDGIRYFQCKAGRGLLEPAKKVYWHGRNVDQVLREESYNHDLNMSPTKTR